MRGAIQLASLLLCATATAAPGPLEQALGRAGLDDLRIEHGEDQVTVRCRYSDKNLDEPRLRGTVVAAMLAIREVHGQSKLAVLAIELAEGQVMQISGDPGMFRAEMDEVSFLRTTRPRFLTRGPALTPAPCVPHMGCKDNPQRCPCPPGSLCEPEDVAADRTGCIVVRAAENALVQADRTVCKPGHTWDQKGFDCVPLPSCGAGALDHGPGCICPPGVERNRAGGCGPLPVLAPDAGPPDAGPTPDGGPGGTGHAATTQVAGFARWVWQAMAAGVVLSAPIALFLLGSILGGLRSRRARIGLRKYCIHCGRKLAMEDTRCRKCKTQQP